MALVTEKIDSNKYVILHDVAVAAGASMTVAAPAGKTYIIQNIIGDKAYEVRQIYSSTLDVLIKAIAKTTGDSIQFAELYAHSSDKTYVQIKNKNGADTMMCVVHCIETQ